MLAASDKRVQCTKQFLEGIRVLKMNGWTEHVRLTVEELRKAELVHHRVALFWRGVNMSLGLAAPCLLGFSMFSSYAALGGSMTPEVIFPALTILRGLQIFEDAEMLCHFAWTRYVWR